MYCIENEFEECKEAIAAQTHQDWELFTVENLPNKEAHDLLYQTFMKRADEFDLFIKIDADMVLCRNTFFEEVVQEMENYHQYNHFEIGVWDFFTDRLIHGLHVFRNNVKWKKTSEKYFVDMVYEPTKKKVFMDIKGPLAPAANHCPNPSLFQSFHFGLHKGAKVLQLETSNPNYKMSKGHLDNIYALIHHYKRSPKIKTLYAILGVKWAFEKKAIAENINYQNNEAKNRFEELNRFEPGKLKRISNLFIKKMNTWLPKDLWKEYMIKKHIHQKNTTYSLCIVYISFLKKRIQKFFL